MKSCNKKILTILTSMWILLLVHGVTRAQEGKQNREGEGYSKNAIYGTFGIIPFVGSSINGNYERRIVLFDRGLLNSIRLKLGYGGWISDLSLDRANYYLIGATFLFFHARSHFEINLYAPQYGNFEFVDTSRPVPGFALGYRFQMEDGLVFRIGGGNPELAYLSLGFCF